MVAKLNSKFKFILKLPEFRDSFQVLMQLPQNRTHENDFMC